MLNPGAMLAGLAGLAACDRVFGLELEGPLDAPTPVCPADYVPVARAPHLYRFVEGPASWQGAAGDCRDDFEGITHLATFATGSELADVAIAAPFPRVGDPLRWEAFVGYARAFDAVNPLEPAAFRAVTGEPVPGSLWGSGEPNNGELMRESVGGVSSLAGGLFDARPSRLRAFICVCDFRPVTLDVLVE